jgi:hypothetical protein
MNTHLNSNLLRREVLGGVDPGLELVALGGGRVGGREVRVPPKRDHVDEQQAQVRGHDREVGKLDGDCR